MALNSLNVFINPFEVFYSVFRPKGVTIFLLYLQGVEGKYIRVGSNLEGMDQPEFIVDQTLGMVFGVLFYKIT